MAQIDIIENIVIKVVSGYRVIAIKNSVTTIINAQLQIINSKKDDNFFILVVNRTILI
jgi:hypothetical protein